MLNSRKIEDLHPIVAAKAKQHLNQCAVRGVMMIFTSTLRDDAYQATLYAQGRTLPGSIVTNAEATGAHGLGLAYDVVPVVDGKAIWDNHEMWRIIGEEGKKLGLTWGGDWKSFVDKPHFELTDGLTFKQLRAGARPAWYRRGDRMFDRVLRRNMTGDDVGRLQTLLNLDGHGLVVDKSFGLATYKAVKAFQKKNKLVSDGIVGPYTQMELGDLMDRPYSIKWYNKYIQVITVPKNRVKELDVIESIGPFETLPRMAKRTKFSLLFNGSLFNTGDGKTGGRYINEGVNMGYNYYSKWGIRVDKVTGKISFTENMVGAKDFLGFGPTLFINGEAVNDTKDLSNSFLNSRHPRTSFADDKDNYYIISAHGRRSWLAHRGMTIPELKAFCKNVLKVINAGNWDGGGSCIVMTGDGIILNMPLEIRGLANAVALNLI